MERKISEQVKEKNIAKDWREGRRIRALELHEKGWKQQAIAEALGISQGRVSQILQVAQEQGIAGLRRRKASGAPPRLKPEQRKELLEMLKQGAEAFDYSGELWTSKRVADLIERQFSVRYHEHHIPKVLRACGWSPQKPEVKASQRDEGAIQAWVAERWPALKKSGTRRTADSVCR